MPLRDHFRPPVTSRSSWEGLHGGWPMAMVQKLAPLLPAEFTAEPRVHLDRHEYQVLIQDQSHVRRLVAAVEIVSPTNKGRPENRSAFVTKCAGLLRQGVCVSILDLVTTRTFNLYEDLLTLLMRPDPTFTVSPPSIYAVTCRCRKVGSERQCENWAYPLVIGEPLPILPVWLSDELSVPLELETSYEETCRVLRIP